MFFSCYTTRAQKNYFKVQEINQREGLPHRSVFDVEQDKDGYIWLSTIGAICRYDGHHITSYDTNYLGIGENAQISIAIDKNNNVWFTEKVDADKQPKGGILDPRKNQLYSFEEYTNGLLATNSILAIDHSSIYPEEWFITTTTGIVYKYSDEFEEIFRFPKPINLFTSCDQDSKGDYWITDLGTVFQVRDNIIKKSYTTAPYLHIIKKSNSVPIFEQIPGTGSFFELKDTLLSPYIFPHTNDISINSMVYSNEGVHYFTARQQKSLLIQDHHGNILFEYERGEKHQGLLKKIVVHNVLEDQQNILWLATNNGLLKIVQKENPFTILQVNNSTRGIYKEGDKLWIGGYKNNVFPKTKLIGAAWEEMLRIPMTQFSKDKEGNIWVGTTSKRLIQYNPKSNEQKLYDLEEKIILQCPFYNKTTDEIWVGTNRGLFVFDEKTETLKPMLSEISNLNPEIRQIYENKEGVWIISNKGLFLLNAENGKIIQYYHQSNQLPNGNLNYLYEDKEGIFWIATKGGGLLEWNRKTNIIKQYRQENGLSNNVIYTIYEDDYQHLWLPSNYGLMSFDKRTDNIEIYLPENGIAHEEFNTFSHFQEKDGTLYFGGINGITKFHPKDLQLKKYDAPLFVEQINILSNESNLFENKTNDFKKNNQIEMNPGDRVIEIELNILDYESSVDNQYAYKIGKNNQQWIYTNNPKISLMNLPYGKYPIQFKARGVSGIWTKEPLELSFKVNRPFYLQIWFFTFIGFLSVFATIMIVKKREKRLEKDKKRLEQIVKKRTLEIEESKELILQQAEGLKVLDKAKTHFFSNITHEFRTPLTLIIGPSQQLLKVSNDDKSHKVLSGVVRNAKIILQLINQLLDISKLESGSMKVDIYKGDIIDYTKTLVSDFQKLAKLKSLKLHFSCRESNWDISFDKEKWNKIIYNLLSNAIKFTPKGGDINIDISNIRKDESTWISLQVKDSGIGIAENKIPNIFNRFYQIDNSFTRHKNGTGIGLALVKELIELQGGTIDVVSRLGQGTIFNIQIPVLETKTCNSYDSYHESSQLISEINPKVDSIYTGNVVMTFKENRGKLSLLLIEDNMEMQNYIISCLDRHKYEISTASNGLEGIKKVQELMPDLVISDVMMPIKNGFEVVHAVRNHIATSHIPVILLTAKAALTSKLEGISRGADAYLTKPFNSEELNLRISKLIEIRQLLQVKYKDNLSNSNTSNSIYKKEDIFIRKVKGFVMEKITDSPINGAIIAEHLKISRMQLHRKIKALTNQTTSQFIQDIQFGLALDLIKEDKLTISEIAYKTGFSTPSNFSRAFKRKYGKPPSDFV